ncbi:Alanine racemase [Raineyella antarctica]|uniref:Alanine racemase n=1 Tax=Raineyella antarctica TaxID=1577474 RepID=A0A1G6HEG2_9ACTN|nr:alanine racemase [Raineyella antarctica]SDB92315.1 Alanine racemase [Raineyella antarctica]
MSGLKLTIDTAAWRAHQRALVDATPGIIPVAKGNGYGFGLERLAAEARSLGVTRLAVGLPHEVARVREHFDGDIVILQPWRPLDAKAVELVRDPRVITTVSRLEDIEVLGNVGADFRPRAVLEVLTSMRRHGLDPEDLAAAEAAAALLDVEGWTIHLPLHSEQTVAEARELSRKAVEAYRAPLWLSHIPSTTAQEISAELTAPGEDLPVRLRVGTALWLGARSAYRTTASVLDVHEVKRGDRIGYHQHRAPGDGWVVVLSGGTAHGIGMEAPTSGSTVRAKAISVATGALEAAGRALSPYTIDGRKRMFVEPPHMQSSMVLVPSSAQPPTVGDEVPVEVRMTTAAFDEVVEA